MENKVAPNGTASFRIGEKAVDLPVLKGSAGPDVVDIRKLYGETDVFTFDPGFTSTASCESQITFIDGDKGILLYRGYPIDELAENASFLEVCYLLLERRAAQRGRIQGLRAHHHAPHHGARSVQPLLPGLPAATRRRWRSWWRRSARCRPSITTASTSTTPRRGRSPRFRLIAKMPTIAAQAFKYSMGQPFV